MAVFPGGDATHLSGLRVTSNLRPCSPAKRSASREKAAAIPRHGIFPGLRRKRLTRATGYGLPTICDPVARLSAAQAGKKPQQYHVTAYSPGCGVNALPGLRVTGNLRPVARLSAARAGKKPQQYHVTAYSPGCSVNALPGLRVTSNLRPCSPAKRNASREEATAIPRHGIFPGLRRKRLTRATGYQQFAAL
ncbi:Uncharacterised protein [Klebsiella michiganensis]|uniref:Uncharacterized protein n=1 Tax=Klebsiella michiganensis TaxID=1134687 RepID=A0A7H4LSA8_9ENTR|nr:Uncharacterised protein [Klebsiella michiganensis]